MIPKIIVVGGGVAGLELANKLGDTLGSKNKATITLIDCNLSHIWKPLLHKIATGSIDSDLESISYLEQAKKHNFNFKLGKLKNIDKKNKQITLSEIRDKKRNILIQEEKIKFDILVLAIGSITNDFEIKGVSENCFFLNNIKQANLLYRKMLNLFIYKKNKEKIKITIVGGGPTGVELSSEIFNMLQKLEYYKFKNLSKKNISITLIEGEKRILPGISKKISKTIYKKLKKIGVSIKTKTFIKYVNQNKLETQSKEIIDSNIIIWTAGIKTPDYMKKIGKLETNKFNQLIIKNTLQTTLNDYIFAIGDCASYIDDKGNHIPARAQSAHQMATLCYKNIILLNKSKKLKKYKYKDHGYLISLSKFKTIGQINKFLFYKKIAIKGKIAKLIYLSLYRIHLIKIYGYFKTILLILISIFNKKIRSKIKIY